MAPKSDLPRCCLAQATTQYVSSRPSARLVEPFLVTQDGLRPLGQFLRRVVVGTVADLPAQVGLRFLEMPLGLRTATKSSLGISS